MDKREYISRLAKTLAENGTRMSGKELAQHLNRNGFKTSYGAEYSGGRGTYRLLSSTYKWLVQNNRQKDADNVATAFPKPDGTYAYE